MGLIAILLSASFTVLAYGAGRLLHQGSPFCWTAPVATATLAIMAGLYASDTDYAFYHRNSACIEWLLAPATSAIGVPLFRHRHLIARHLVPALLAICCGGFATFATAVILATLLDLAPLVIHSIGIKSVTTPIAVELAHAIGGDPGLIASFVVATGMIGAVLGRFMLDRCNVVDPVARGLAFGTIAQGFGTVQAMAEGEIPGAVSAMAMGITAVVVSIWAPPLTQLLG